MQNQTKDTETKLVSLFGARNAAAKDDDAAKTDVKEEGFFDAIKKNSDNEERLRKERLKANQSVLKSYRIKN